MFSGLNCGLGSSDQSDIVSINRARVASYFDLPADAIVGVHQVHSARALGADAPFSPLPEADGIVTTTPGIVLAVLTADCQPILFHDAKNGVVAAAHAGWRGALDGVIEATVQCMLDHGAERGKISAAIGPSISQQNYEVGPEFKARFLEVDPQFAQFFTAGKNDHFQFDLPAFGLWQLRQSGVKSAHWTGHCTYADEQRFFSYRRSVHKRHADYGRLMSAIRLPG